MSWSLKITSKQFFKKSVLSCRNLMSLAEQDLKALVFENKPHKKDFSGKQIYYKLFGKILQMLA